MIGSPRGAELRAEYIERGQWVTTIVRTIPADGVGDATLPGICRTAHP